jgi:DNA polymerase phi
MARKAKKKVVEEQPSTEEESVHDDGDVEMDSEEGDDIPDIVDKDSGDDDEEEDDADDDAMEVEETKKSKTSDEKKSKKKSKKESKKKTGQKVEAIPFMDTFYQLSSEDSPKDRAVAARDLLHHCFLTDQGINHKDAAYALTRLMNGLCTGRAASRQGFASCLTSFLRIAYSTTNAVEDILKEDDYGKKQLGADTHPAMIIRQKLLLTTQVLAPEESTAKGKSKGKQQKFGGKMKGIEERDHVFGRLFGILAVVRSGVLSSEDFPSEVVEGYTNDLIELYHYKKWMREPSSHAIIELVSSLDAEPNADLIVQVANNVIVPSFFLSKGSNVPANTDLTDRQQLLQSLTAEQIAVALQLQSIERDISKFNYPLDEPLVTAESVPALSVALASTSSVIHPRCHAVWNALWVYLTEEVEGQDKRQLRSDEQYSSIIKKIIENVVVDILLGKGEQKVSSTHENRSLALQIVSALCGSSDLKISVPADLIGSILCPDVVTRVFINVFRASGGVKKGKQGNPEHHLKPLTSQVLKDMIDNCCEESDIDRRMAFAKAFLFADPRFDTTTKTQTVSTLLMMENSRAEVSDEKAKQREALWQQYLSFLEEKIVLASSLHDATLYIELMYKLAKCDLNRAPANEARRVVRFFMSGAFFDCTDLSDPSSATKKTPKKKKGKAAKASTTPPPPELSSGLRIKEILKDNGMDSISFAAREIMASRFFSLLSDFIGVINSQSRGVKTNKHFYGKGSKPESIYRALSDVFGIRSLLETSGAKTFEVPSKSSDSDEGSDAEDPMETSTKLMARVQSIADDALVSECGSGDEDILRAKSVFATGCASLMMTLSLQLNSCGKPNSEEEEDDEVAESVHEFISDLADCVEGFCKVIGDKASPEEAEEEEENPMAAMAGLLVNILSSPVGGEDTGESSQIQQASSKLTRETVKLAWSGIISVLNGLSAKNPSLKSLVDEDVMSILIESVCGEKAMGEEDGDEEDDESSEASESSEDGLGGSAVFVNAAETGMDLDDVKAGSSDDSNGDDNSSQDSPDEDGDEDVELDAAKVENLLLEDSDAEMSDSNPHGILEHHAGADKALAQLIKLKQDARKASQSERERVELLNRRRCAVLLDSLFSASVFKSGWLPIEAVLGSIVPILRSCKALAKSIQTSSSANAKKSLNEKNALLKHLYTMVNDKISKFRCSGDTEAEELALKASADIFAEIKSSLNADHCSSCSVALVTTVRCIPNVEENDEVKGIYQNALEDWTTHKATKIHRSVFDDVVKRMPSLAVVSLVEPLVTAAKEAKSAYLKCESIKLLSEIYKHDTSSADEQLSDKARSAMKELCGKVAEAFAVVLGDADLQKGKNRERKNDVLHSTKDFIHYVKAHDEGLLSDSELSALQESLKTVGSNCNSAGMKQLCSQVSDIILALPRQAEEEKPKRSTRSAKTPKSSKKKKTKN